MSAETDLEAAQETLAHLRRAVEAQKTRADNAEARAGLAETAMSRYAEWAQRYDIIAEEAAMGIRMMALNLELRRRLAVWERRVLGGPRTLRRQPDGGMIPRIVCLCGSTRFGDAFRTANLAETLAGHIVLSIGCDSKSDAELAVANMLGADPETVKRHLDELHRRKVDLADEVVVVSRDGYYGDSTAAEIAYAVEHGKPVRFMEPAAGERARAARLVPDVTAETETNQPEETK